MKMRVKRDQVVILTAGVVTLLLLGLLYVWSIFVVPLEYEFGWNRAQTSLTYTISMICFTLGMMAAGWFGKKRVLRKANFLGICLVGIGFAVVSQTSSLMMFYLFYGVFAGFGIGLCYNAWLSTVLSHFPGRTGIASGCLLLGFGVGGIALGPVVYAMIYSQFGWRNTFLAIGAFIFLEGLLAMRFLRAPAVEPSVIPAEPSVSSPLMPNLTTSATVREPSFWLFGVWKMILFCVGVAIIGQTAPIMLDMGATPGMAAAAVALISAGSSISRVVTGMFYDRFGYRVTMLLLSLIFMACCLIYWFGYPTAMVVSVNTAMFLMGVASGGTVILTATFISDIYGPENFSANFGISNILNVPAILILSSAIAAMRANTGVYTPFFTIMLILGVISCILMIAIDRAVKRMTRRGLT